MAANSAAAFGVLPAGSLLGSVDAAGSLDFSELLAELLLELLAEELLLGLLSLDSLLFWLLD